MYVCRPMQVGLRGYRPIYDVYAEKEGSGLDGRM